MKQIGKSNSRHAQVYLNSAYDVVAQNGIIMGSVRYAFVNGDGLWCIAITGHNSLPYYGESMHEIESLFDLREGEPSWTTPVAQRSNVESYEQLGEFLAANPEPNICEDFLAMDALMSEPALSLPLLTEQEPAMKS